MTYYCNMKTAPIAPKMLKTVRNTAPAPNDGLKSIMTAVDLAEVLQVRPTLIQRWVRDGIIPSKHVSYVSGKVFFERQRS